MFYIERQAQKKLISFQIKIIYFPKFPIPTKMNNNLIGFKLPKFNPKEKKINKKIQMGLIICIWINNITKKGSRAYS